METQIVFKTKEEELIIQRLKENGYRITPQRKCIIETIIHSDCHNVKDIYFQASKKDKTIGIATVYRVVRILEELEIIRCSTIDINHECVNCQKPDTILFLSDDEKEKHKVTVLEMPKWMEYLKKELRKRGMLENEKISIVIRKSCDGIQNCENGCTTEKKTETRKETCDGDCIHCSEIKTNIMEK